MAVVSIGVEGSRFGYAVAWFAALLASCEPCVVEKGVALCKNAQKIICLH
jgi:hypothetical protein